jgi:hypothetical protein
LSTDQPRRDASDDCSVHEVAENLDLVQEVVTLDRRPTAGSRTKVDGMSRARAGWLVSAQSVLERRHRAWTGRNRRVAVNGGCTKSR